jgi:hypothetical protein
LDSHRPFICSVASLLLSLFVIFLLFLLMLSTLLLPMVIAAVEALESMLLFVTLLLQAFLLLLLNLLLPISFLIFNTKIVVTAVLRSPIFLSALTRRLSSFPQQSLYNCFPARFMIYRRKSVKNTCSGKKSANHESSVLWTNR